MTEPSMTPIYATIQECYPFFLIQISAGQYLIFLLLPYYYGYIVDDGLELGGLAMIPVSTVT